MPCYHPISAYRTSSGVYFHDVINSSPIKLPCGRCIGCRLERSRQWAVRLVHEKRFHEESAFITLTYDDEHLPEGGSLNVKHFQDFMKRLRDRLGYAKLRFFHAGEYGEKFGRPHYHAIIFGHSFMDDAREIKTTDRGDRTWVSPLLLSTWPHGINRVGEATFESAAYVARYITKKVTGSRAASHYERTDPRTGEIFSLKPEYCTMSRRPGIGALHVTELAHEIYPRDEIISRGHPSKPPRFYDKYLEKLDPEAYALLKENRECALALSPIEERSPHRLSVKETVKLAKIGQLKRNYEIA